MTTGRFGETDIDDLLRKFRYRDDGNLLRVVKYGKPCKPYIPYTAKNNSGYFGVRVNSVCKIELHVAIWVYHNLRWPEFEIDHRNRDKDDNRIINLRELDRLSQRQNVGLHAASTSGVRNVCFHKPSGLWRVVFRFDGEVFTTYFKSKKDAIRNAADIVNPVTRRDQIVMGMTGKVKKYEGII